MSLTLVVVHKLRMGSVSLAGLVVALADHTCTVVSLVVVGLVASLEAFSIPHIPSASVAIGQVVLAFQAVQATVALACRIHRTSEAADLAFDPASDLAFGLAFHLELHLVEDLVSYLSFHL